MLGLIHQVVAPLLKGPAGLFGLCRFDVGTLGGHARDRRVHRARPTANGRALAEERCGTGSMGEVEHAGDDLAPVGRVLHLPGGGKRLHQQQAAAALGERVGGCGQVQQVRAGVLDGQV